MVAAISIISITKREFHPKLENTHRCEKEGMLTEWFHTLFTLSLSLFIWSAVSTPKHCKTVSVYVYEHWKVKMCGRTTYCSLRQLICKSRSKALYAVHVVLMFTCLMMSSLELIKFSNVISESTIDYTACEAL